MLSHTQPSTIIQHLPKTIHSSVSKFEGYADLAKCSNIGQMIMLLMGSDYA